MEEGICVEGDEGDGGQSQPRRLYPTAQEEVGTLSPLALLAIDCLRESNTRPCIYERGCVLVHLKPVWRAPSGTAFVLGFIAVFVAGWFAYRTTIPPTWLRDFGSEIAFRATPDPLAPPPNDTRQATPRGLARNPYICLAHVIHLPWDRFVAVTERDGLLRHPVLSQVKWPRQSLEDMAQRLSGDARYQLVVLLQGDRVVGAHLFYTFWAELDAISRPEGFSREEAVFTAVVKGGTYVLAPITDAPADACTLGN